jgi:hypothetical protein
MSTERANVIQHVTPPALLLIANLTNSASFADETITYPDLVSRLTDLGRRAISIVEGEKPAVSTSHDRRSRYNEAPGRYENWTADGDSRGRIRREDSDLVTVDLEGPGVVWRIWSAKPEFQLPVNQDSMEQLSQIKTANG